MLSVARLGAAMALAFTLAGTASADIVTFEDQKAFYCNTTGSNSSGGLNYTVGYADCYYSPDQPADFPTRLSSTVMASGYGDTVFTRAGGGVFDLFSVDLAFGPFSHSGLESDTTTVTGTLFGGGTVSTVLTVGYPFQTYQLDWKQLTSVSFGQLANTSEYLAFDNIVYNAIPEPASWAMMVSGFGLAGAMMRRQRRRTRLA